MGAGAARAKVSLVVFNTGLLLNSLCQIPLHDFSRHQCLLSPQKEKKFELEGGPKYPGRLGLFVCSLEYIKLVKTLGEQKEVRAFFCL
jgi:hypothetical protein